MIALDTNVLVHAHRSDSEWYDTAAAIVRQLAEGSERWAIPWPCVHEWLAVVTHPRIWDPPSPIDVALAQVDAWLESPNLVLLGESANHWRTLGDQVRAGHITGARVHDARVAALCLDHGVRELWTADRDFGRFPTLVARNPLA